MFDREACSTPGVDVGCIFRRSLYAFAALGLQFHYDDMEYMAAGFVTQKGHPEKAQWISVQDIFAPVVFEAQITTPDGMYAGEICCLGIAFVYLEIYHGNRFPC